MRQILADFGIQTGVHYPVPVHKQPAFSYLGYGDGDFAQCERLSRNILSLPMYAELSEEQQHQVIRVLRYALDQVA